VFELTFDIAVAVILAIWLAATVVRHLPSRLVPPAIAARVNDGTAAWLVPSWNFFAPSPGIHTYTILYRDEQPDGSMSLWHEVLVPRRHRWSRGAWHPEKTLSKAVTDLSLELVRVVYAGTAEPAIVRISIPYLTVLAYVAALPRHVAVPATQFVILQRDRRESKVLFLSGVHALR